MPKAAPEINDFRSIRTVHGKYHRQNKNFTLQGMMDEHHSFLRKMKLDLAVPLTLN
jgi:hypothetical protein